MVCLGNICRSPMAQVALENMVRERSLAVIVDSAGTENWHFNNEFYIVNKSKKFLRSWTCFYGNYFFSIEYDGIYGLDSFIDKF